MSGNKCCVVGCLNSYPKAPAGTTWHPFPKNANLAEKWRVKIDESVKITRNTLVCSDHFDEKDFKTSSYDTRNKRKILLSSAVPSIFKCKKIAEISEPNIHVLDIPSDVWEHIFKYLPSSKDIVALSSVCKQFQHNVQALRRSFDEIYKNNRLDMYGLLNYTLSKTCTSINLSLCYWLKPSEILEIIEKTNVQHLHVIECNIDAKCMKVICDLRLTSPSIMLTTEWLNYFENNIGSIQCFKQLKNLKLFYKNSSRKVLFEIYFKVLIHCKELEVLKMYQRDTKHNFFNKRDYDEILPRPTPVPKLKSLFIYGEKFGGNKIVAKFIELILKDKVIPLQDFDFGIHSGYLYKNNVILDPKFFLEKSTLSIISSNTSFNFWLNFQPIQNLISQKNYKSIIVEDVSFDGFYEFAQRMVLTSSKTLKVIRIIGRTIYPGNYRYPQFLNGISHMVINCPQLTIVDVSGHRLNADYYQDSHYLSNAIIQKNKALLNDLTNLKNLKKLMISPTILHCRYYKANGKQTEKALPFWKVTSTCKHLMEIPIIYDTSSASFSCVHEDSLNAIVLSANLKILHLAGFQVICKQSLFDLSKITQVCSQLQKLYVRKVNNLFVGGNTFSKNIKTISIDTNLICDKMFLDNLSLCLNLKKMFFKTLTINECHCNRLGNVLRKLKNLNAIIFQYTPVKYNKTPFNRTENRWKYPVRRRLGQIFQSIQNEKPEFFFSLDSTDKSDIPEAYLGLTL